jgi:hypothetical protein
MALKHPPEVVYPTGARGLQWLVLGALALSWLAGLGLWWQAYAGPTLDMPATWWAMLLAGLVVLSGSAWRIRVTPAGELHWQPPVRGQGTPSRVGQWRWFSPAWRTGLPLQRVDCVLDLDRCMVLRLQTVAGWVTWAWCHQAQAPERWSACRRAVHARATQP